MTEVVLDASVVIKWWRSRHEAHLREARSLLESFRSGDISVVAPPLLFLEILNAFARRWLWSQAALLELARALRAARFDLEDPDLESVARWTGAGLTAYDATYVALAESRGITLITDDDALVSSAPSIARPLTT